VGVAEKGTNSAVCYGDCRFSQGTLGTDKRFTGQRLDNTGLYYYGARYYDPTIGRFISADTIVPNPADPQSLNRYSYCINNPLKYTDPSGHWPNWSSIGQFFKGAGESIFSTVASAFPPYQLYTQVIVPIKQLASQEIAYQDLQTNPAQMWEGIKSYYDVTTPLGLGHLTGTAAVIVASTAASIAGSSGPASTIAGNSKTATNIPKVFYSGKGAEEAAIQFAKNNGFQTLLDSAYGQRCAEIVKGMSYEEARPYWEAASRLFAQEAKGNVYCVQNPNLVNIDSIWAQIEYPTLVSNPSVRNIFMGTIDEFSNWIGYWGK